MTLLLFLVVMFLWWIHNKLDEILEEARDIRSMMQDMHKPYERDWTEYDFINKEDNK